MSIDPESESFNKLKAILLGVLLIYLCGLIVTTLTYAIALAFDIIAVKSGLTAKNPFQMIFNASWNVTVFTWIAPFALTFFVLALILDWTVPFACDVINGLQSVIVLHWTEQAGKVLTYFQQLVDLINSFKPQV